MMSVSRVMMALLAATVAMGGQAQASIVVDFSPDTTHAPYGGFLYDGYGTQIIGDRFTLANDTILDGGAVFSHAGWVGDPRRFLVYADIGGAPDATPLLDIAVAVDTVDTLFTTTQPALWRSHASIAPTLLPAGTYWFSMPGDKWSGVFYQALTTFEGGYDDGVCWLGNTRLGRAYEHGDMYFQLDGTPVPEPSSVAIWSLMGLVAVGCGWRRKCRN